MTTERPSENAPGDQKGGRWSSRSVGTPLQHRIFYILIRLGGRRAAYLLLYFVVAYYMLLRPVERRKTEPYLRRRFPDASPAAMLLHSYRMSLELGKVLVDRAVVGICGPKAMRVKLEGREELLRLRDEERGVILVTSHVGCWQVAMSVLDFLQRPVNMLMRRDEGDVDRHYFEHSGENNPFHIIDPGGYLGGTLEMMGVLKGGEVLCIMGDRVMGGERSTVDAAFLGGTVRLPYSPYKLASATGAPVVVLFSYKTGPDSYELRIGDVIRVPGGLGRSEKAYAPYAGRYAEVLEAFTDDYPYQFFNFFDMWK